MLISQSSTGASGASIVTARSTDNGGSWQSLGTVTSGITSTTIGNDNVRGGTSRAGFGA